MYTTETPGFTAPTPALIAARIKAAGRISDERKIARARARAHRAQVNAYVDRLLADLRSSGAVRVGWKIVMDEGGKWRGTASIDDPWLHGTLASTYGADAEVWGIRADGSYCTEVF